MLVALGVPGTRLFALDPTLAISQYKHSRWTVDDDVPAPIIALAQGRDGFLWIGSRYGLYRFDGIRFEKIEPERRVAERLGVSTLMAARDGSIWVGYQSGGVAVYRKGVLRDTGLASGHVKTLVETRDGRIWANIGAAQPLLYFEHGRWSDRIARSLGSNEIHGIAATADGALWLATEYAMYKLKAGSPRFERQTIKPRGHSILSIDRGGRLWLSDANGTRVIFPTDTLRPGREAYHTPAFPRAGEILFDRDGNLWGSDLQRGLFRIPTPDPAGAHSPVDAKPETFTTQQGLETDNVSSLAEDREGTIWVATMTGLERFRTGRVVADPALTRITQWGFALLRASDGSVYVGQRGSIYRVAPGQKPKLFLSHASETQALCEGQNHVLWAVQRDTVLKIETTHITSIAGPHFSPDTSHLQDCVVDRSGSLWLSTGSDGLFRRTDTGWEHIPLPRGSDASAGLVAARDGTALVHLSPDLLGRIDGSRLTVRKTRSGNGLRDIFVFTDTPSGILAGGRAGLARIGGHRIQYLSGERFPTLTNIAGIVESADGSTWMIAQTGIIRIQTRALQHAFADPQAPLRIETLDTQDGLSGGRIVYGHHDAVRGGDGRLWFATNAGVVWVDPARDWRSQTPPPVAITAIRAGGVTYRDPDRIALPAGTSEGEIDFAALSLSIPKRVQVRYRLEGLDAAWVDPGMRRQMFFSNLGPGTYRFRVIAANADGVWNRQGASLEFAIPPTFSQSGWFKLLCATAGLIVLWLLYSMRLRQVTAQLQAGLEVRLAERERIARELHDTLLQGFQALILRFQAVAERTPATSPMRELLNRELDLADSVLVESRDRVGEVRAAQPQGELADHLLRYAAALDADPPIDVELNLEGRPRELHPIVHEEVQRIGEEALRNAFRHSQARAIRISISYHKRRFTLAIRDGGVGLPAGIDIEGGRPGHFGLPGIRERAHRIGARITIVSRRDEGTEVMLALPGRAAYALRGRPLWPFARFRRR